LALSQKEAITRWIYEHEPTYTPGGSLFARGLFSWEEQLFLSPPFPQQGRLLIAAAGGGRESAWFAARGFSVCGFEPAGEMIQVWETSGGHDRVDLRRASFRDWLSAVEKSEGVLAAWAQERFDGAVLGWGSFSYVEPSERVRLLAAFRRVVPRGPLALSFLSGDGLPPESAHEFLPWAGFVYRPTRAALVESAAQAGYRLASFAWDPYTRALLLPVEPSL
jgi:hypothetical protein